MEKLKKTIVHFEKSIFLKHGAWFAQWFHGQRLSEKLFMTDELLSEFIFYKKS